MDSRLNIIVGPNAFGKTTLLEGLSLITNLESFRTRQLSEVVSEGRREGSVSAELLRPVHSKILVGIEDGRKRIKMDGAAITKPKYPYLGSSITFVPDDLYLVKGGPDQRRDLLDAVGRSIDEGYDEILERFERTLKQRNQILKMIKNSPHLTLDLERELGIWTEHFVEAAAPLFEVRAQIVSAIGSVLTDIYKELFEVPESLQVEYEHPYRDRSESDFASAMLARLNQLAEAERAVGYSLSGPHRDDLLLTIDGREAKTFASQGQIRGAVIALKVAQLELSRKHRSVAPILLLDDIISELDDRRTRALVMYLKNYPGQLFVTTAEVAKVKTLHEQFAGFKVIDLTRSEVRNLGQGQDHAWQQY